MLAYPHSLASYAVPVQPALSEVEGSVPDFAVSLPSMYGSPQAILRLANTSRRHPSGQGTSTLWNISAHLIVSAEIFICIFKLFQQLTTSVRCILMQGTHKRANASPDCRNNLKCYEK